MLGRLVIAAMLSTSVAFAALPQPKGERVLQTFDYHGVTLLDGPLRRQVDEIRDFYLRIPNDDLLRPYRARTGRPAPGQDLRGWYCTNGYNAFPQILSGLARMYAGTGDPACKAKAEALLAEWSKCIEPDGFFYISRQSNAYHYIYDKFVGALVDLHHYCGSTLALGCLSRITDWAEKNLNRDNLFAFSWWGNGTEWYTLSENLYRAYLETGEPRYRDFAKVWEYRRYWDLYYEKRDIFDASETRRKGFAYHAYSHVNTLCGLGAGYAVTGDAYYLAALTNAYDYLHDHQCYATGGYGPGENLLPHDDFVRSVERSHHSFETQCGCWAGFKLSKYLLAFTGDARFGDWTERLAVNGIGASIPNTAEGGVFYYSDYNSLGGRKLCLGGDAWCWACCTGTRPMAAADFHDLIYFHDAKGVYVNLYTPSRLAWQRAGVSLELTEATRFPESDRVELTLSLSKKDRFALCLRVPGWLAAPMEISVSGERVEYRAEKDWARLEREWRDGDRISVRLPMNFWRQPVQPDVAWPAAILYGPTVLSFRAPGGNPAKQVDLARLAENFVPETGEALTYHLTSDASILVRPFYAWKEGERYFVYLDPAKSSTYSYQSVELSREWTRGGEYAYTNAVGATAKFTFEGTGVRWLGWRFDDCGYAEITIDGKVVGKVDQYAPERRASFDWKYEGLAPGRHTLELKILPDKPAESKSTFINIAGFEVLGGK